MDDVILDELYALGLLCDICEAARGTQKALYHDAFVCDDCASSEPYPDEGA